MSLFSPLPSSKYRSRGSPRSRAGSRRCSPRGLRGRTERPGPGPGPTALAVPSPQRGAGRPAAPHPPAARWASRCAGLRAQGESAARGGGGERLSELTCAPPAGLPLGAALRPPGRHRGGGGGCRLPPPDLSPEAEPARCGPARPGGRRRSGGG